MPVTAWVDLMALVVRNDRSVSIRAPPSKSRLSSGFILASVRSGLTISVTTRPSFLRCLRGAAVARAAISSSSTRRAPSARTIRKALSSGKGAPPVPSRLA